MDGIDDEDVPSRTELVHTDPAFKAAQKGDKVAERQLESLMENMKLTTKDSILFTDLYPHAGDRAKAIRSLIKKDPQGNNGHLHYLGLAAGTAGKNVTFPQRRMQIELVRDWLNGALDFKQVDGHGHLSLVKPNRTVPEPTREQLSLCPGAQAAWDGIQGVEWQVLQLQGAGLTVAPQWMAEFAQAPPAVAEEFNLALEEHKRKYQSALVDLIDPERKMSMSSAANESPNDESPANEAVDPRPGPVDGGADGASAPAYDELVEFDSKAALESSQKITISLKSMAKGVEVLRTDGHVTYLLASAGTTLAPSTIIGGFGGGNWAASDPNNKRVLTWELPQGDKTVVSLQRGRTEEPPAANETEEAKPNKSKTKDGTLYSIIRDLEREGHSQIKVLAFGLATPAGQPGRHGYTFTHDPKRTIDFILRGEADATKFSGANCFNPGTTKKLYEGPSINNSNNNNDDNNNNNNLNKRKTHSKTNENK